VPEGKSYSASRVNVNALKNTDMSVEKGSSLLVVEVDSAAVLRPAYVSNRRRVARTGQQKTSQINSVALCEKMPAD